MSSIGNQYKEQGYLTRIDVLDEVDLAAAQQALNALEESVEPEKRAIGLVSRHRDTRAIWDLATHPRILDAVEAVYGPNIVLLGTHFFTKYPSSGDKFVAWHQDVTYWGLEPARAITAWLAVDDADVENGCMRVVAESHKLGLLDHGKSTQEGNLLSVNQEVDTRYVDESKIVDIELRAGQMSLHDGILIHGSNPNRSNRRRAGLTLRYTSADTKFVGNENHAHAWHPVIVRGEADPNGMPCVDPPFAMANRA